MRGRDATRFGWRSSRVAAGAAEAAGDDAGGAPHAISAATRNAHAVNAAVRDERQQVIRYSTVMHRTTLRHGFHLLAGPVADFVSKEASSAALAAQGLWRRDPAVWSIDRNVQDTISRRLGWLDSPALMLSSIGRIRAAAHEVRDAGFTDVVLLG